MTILQIVFDNRHGTTVPDGRAQAFVDDTFASFEASTNDFMTVVVGTEVMLSFFQLKYLQLWNEAGEKPQNIVFFDDADKVEVADCGYIPISAPSVWADVLFAIEEERIELTSTWGHEGQRGD